MYDKENDFDIVPMTKRELAQLYAPDLTPHSAVNRLMNWVERNPHLMAELSACGYRKHSRLLTVMQVGAILKYLGAP